MHTVKHNLRGSFSLHTGRYPFHFHMCFDMRNATHPPYVRENSIHDVFSRCITVHGSHGVMVIDINNPYPSNKICHENIVYFLHLLDIFKLT